MRATCKVDGASLDGRTIGLMHLGWTDIDGIITDVRVTDIKLSKHIRNELRKYTLIHEYAHFVSYCMVPEAYRYMLATEELTTIERFFGVQFDTKVFDPLMNRHYELIDVFAKTGLANGYTVLPTRDPAWNGYQYERVAVFYSMLCMDQKFVMETVPDVVRCFLKNASEGMYGMETADLFVPYAGDGSVNEMFEKEKVLTVTL